VVNNPKQSLVSCKQYLSNPFSFKSDGSSIDKPCFTLIARMDKMPPYLITTEQGVVGIAIYENDSPMTKKVKEFMAMYGIVDIKMRMLNIGELIRIMGFPTDYVLVGTQAEQKKFIGNAVEVNMSRVLCEALCEKLERLHRIAI
jgi:DNA (cytosine-5)-methyltransferase 1